MENGKDKIRKYLSCWLVERGLAKILIALPVKFKLSHLGPQIEHTDKISHFSMKAVASSVLVGTRSSFSSLNSSFCVVWISPFPTEPVSSCLDQCLWGPEVYQGPSKAGWVPAVYLIPKLQWISLSEDFRCALPPAQRRQLALDEGFQVCRSTWTFSRKLFQFLKHEGLQQMRALDVFTVTFLTIHFLFMHCMHWALHIAKKATRKEPHFTASHCVSRTEMLNERRKLVREILH